MKTAETKKETGFCTGCGKVVPISKWEKLGKAPLQFLIWKSHVKTNRINRCVCGGKTASATNFHQRKFVCGRFKRPNKSFRKRKLLAIFAKHLGLVEAENFPYGKGE